jgi:hypothetical protein
MWPHRNHLRLMDTIYMTIHMCEQFIWQYTHMCEQIFYLQVFLALKENVLECEIIWCNMVINFSPGNKVNTSPRTSLGLLKASFIATQKQHSQNSPVLGQSEATSASLWLTCSNVSDLHTSVLLWLTCSNVSDLHTSVFKVRQKYGGQKHYCRLVRVRQKYGG